MNITNTCHELGDFHQACPCVWRLWASVCLHSSSVPIHQRTQGFITILTSSTEYLSASDCSHASSSPSRHLLLLASLNSELNSLKRWISLVHSGLNRSSYLSCEVLYIETSQGFVTSITKSGRWSQQPFPLKSSILGRKDPYLHFQFQFTLVWHLFWTQSCETRLPQSSDTLQVTSLHVASQSISTTDQHGGDTHRVITKPEWRQLDQFPPHYSGKASHNTCVCCEWDKVCLRDKVCLYHVLQ